MAPTAAESAHGSLRPRCPRQQRAPSEAVATVPTAAESALGGCGHFSAGKPLAAWGRRRQVVLRRNGDEEGVCSASDSP